jgi:pyruvate dehydrogenase E2 component (dihydrolipoamide acetyltransferase)
MPSGGASATEGTLVRWFKREGESVERGELLFEVESDKAMLEVEAQSAGILHKILVADGTSGVAVDEVVGLLVANDERAEAVASSSKGPAEAPSPAAIQAPVARHAQPAIAVSNIDSGGRILASPLARRQAVELAVDLAAVGGRGPNGRILRADVEAAAARGKTAAIASPKTAAIDAPALAALERGDERIPHSNMRRVIAQRLGEAKRAIPHFYLTIDCCVDELLKLRQKFDQQASGFRPTVNDFIVRAAARALRRVPECNAAWTDDAIIRYRSVDISVAVATPGGLMTPIVREADQKSLSSISAEIRNLAARAKEGRLKPAEYQGGSLTISNLGMYGIREFTAIVNPPQACILAIGASEPRPVVRDGGLAVATQMSCTLSADHRVVDGALGAKFLAEFKRLIENPD